MHLLLFPGGPCFPSNPVTPLLPVSPRNPVAPKWFNLYKTVQMLTWNPQKQVERLNDYWEQAVYGQFDRTWSINYMNHNLLSKIYDG